MDSDPKGIAWVGNVFQKFEDMCLEVEDTMWKDGMKYIEDQLQTVGENVKQFCSGFVQDVFPELSVYVANDATSDSLVQESTTYDSSVQDSKTNDSSIQESIRNCKILKEVMDEDKLEQELHNALEFHHPSIKDSKVEQFDLSLEETNDAESNGKTACIKENLSDMRQDQLEISDIITLGKKYPSMSLSAAPIDVVKNNSFAQSSDSVEVLDTTSADESAKSIWKLDSLINDDNNKESSCEAKLDESCFIIIDSELSYVSQEALRHRSCKEKLKEVFAKKRGAQKLDHQQEHATSFVSLFSASKGQGGEYSASSSLTTSNPDYESSESDWEMV